MQEEDGAARAVELGRTVMTVAAERALQMEEVLEALHRHAACDWGLVCDEDREANELAIRSGARLFSVYESGSGERFWVITEADRSVTTVLLPDDY